MEGGREERATGREMRGRDLIAWVLKRCCGLSGSDDIYVFPPFSLFSCLLFTLFSFFISFSFPFIHLIDSLSPPFPFFFLSFYLSFILLSFSLCDFFPFSFPFPLTHSFFFPFFSNSFHLSFLSSFHSFIHPFHSLVHRVQASQN